MMRTIKMKPAIKEHAVDKKYDTLDEGGESGHKSLQSWIHVLYTLQ